ncbi:hypothetical protein [Thermocatellispora tengchongensis]|uniref:hypothetical protein n=1 Tax=Thermocatellispora tengchongensis TaxID=1073253 RepID=UPI0036414F35
MAGHAVAAGRHVSTSIVEVLVESTRAQEVAAKLRAEGYEARVRGGTTEPPPDEPTLTTEPPPDEPTLTTEPAATTEPTLTIEPPRGGPTRGEPPLDEPVPTEPKPPSQDPPSTAAGRPGDSYPTAALPQAARPAPGPSGSVADAVREGER